MAMPPSRAGFHAIHHRGNEKTSANASRKNLLKEAMRDLSPQATSYWAARRESIVVTETHKNVSFVNDGNGGFTQAQDVSEVNEYAKNREALLARKPSDKQVKFTTLVSWAPTSMLIEQPDFYDRFDPDSENPLISFTGETMTRSRFIAKDDEEMARYFQEVVDFWARTLPGGQDAIHGYAINYDESRPHIHVFVDSYAPCPDDPYRLRTNHSRFWTQNRDVVWPEGHEKAGQAIMGKFKMERLQQEFKDLHHELGIEIEKEKSERAGRNLSLPDFIALKEAEFKLKEKQTLQDAVATRLSKAEKDNDELTKRLSEKEEDLEKKQAAADEIIATKQQIFNHATNEGVRRQKELEEENEKAQQDLQTLQDQLATARSQYEAMEEGIAKAEKSIADGDKVERQRKANSTMLASINRDRTTLDNREDRLKKKEEQFDQRLEKAVSEKVQQMHPKEVERILGQLAKDKPRIERELRDTKADLRTYREKAQAAREDHAAALRDFSDMKDELTAARNELAQARNEVDEIKANKQTLSKLTADELYKWVISNTEDKQHLFTYIKELGGTNKGLKESMRKNTIDPQTEINVAEELAKYQASNQATQTPNRQAPTGPDFSG